MKKIKKTNRKGFTLIELLAVIVIMGILMLVAIPAVSRTILNSRRSTFENTALQYINAVKNMVSSEGDDLKCCKGTDCKHISDFKATTNFYINFTNCTNAELATVRTDGNSPIKQISALHTPTPYIDAHDLLEQGGNSSWNNTCVYGSIRIYRKINSDKPEFVYYIKMADKDKHGTGNVLIQDSALSRNSIKTSNGELYFINGNNYYCTIDD